MKTKMTIFASLLLAGFVFTGCNDDDDDNYTPDEKIVNATLKWFNSTKGFGFAQLSTGEDVFIHSNLLKKRSISNLEPNQQLTLKIRYTNLGYEAVDIAVSPAPSGDSTEPAN